jgi:hypothetical protein
MRCTKLLAGFFFLLATAAQAHERHESSSLAYLMAKRVAAKQNNQELPSRAVWLGSRVAINHRQLAALEPKSKKPQKRRPISQLN